MITFEYWQQLWHNLQGQTDPKPAYDSLVALYSEPHRAYHTLDHVADCLAEFAAVKDLASRPQELELALCLHDVIYDPHAADNEEQSVGWAEVMMAAAQMSPEAVQAVSDLILATRHTATMPTDLDCQLIVDIDLSILGRPPDIFDRYESQIRLEYQWVPLEQYRFGRSQILQSFLDRDQIYHFSRFQEIYEPQARVNLARSLARLAGPPADL